jgi:uncharacterized repeat protein (TIGR03803 family)
MELRLHRLSSFTLISLLSLFSFSSQTGTQDNVFAQLGGPSELQGTTGKIHKASSQVDTSDYGYSVLYNFCSAPNCTDGAAPQAGLIQDAAFNLFGTTTAGGGNSNPSCGSNGCGTVFKLDNTGHETVLYSFCSAPNCTDGAAPQAGLIQDAARNLYGTTEVGGANANSNCSNGCGTVFEVDNTGHETVLYSFCSITVGGPPCLDGSSPQAGLIQDAAGNFYGTTKFGGPGNGGTVFKLDNTGHETVVDGFCEIEPNCPDGSAPEAGLIQDAAGNLYGTTSSGGIGFFTVGGGTVFKLGAVSTVLYNFCIANGCPDGSVPAAGLIQDAAGNLYGTTSHGGAGAVTGFGDGGTVFKVDTAAHHTIIYSFCSAANCTDGQLPAAGLIQDAAGNLFGTTTAGGGNSNPSCGSNGCGTVFKLDNTGHETVLYSFCSAPNCTDGAAPQAGLIHDAAGNLYGTTTLGGVNGGGGTVFKVTPTLIITGTSVNVSRGATAASTITVTPGATFTGSVALTAAVTSSPTDAQNLPTLSFGSTSPVSIAGPSGGTATLTITTTAATNGALEYPRRRPAVGLFAASATGLALILLIAIPARLRSRHNRLGILIFLLIFIGGFIACGGGGSSGHGPGNPGTTPGAYTVTVTGTSGSTNAEGTVTLTVQ